MQHTVVRACGCPTIDGALPSVVLVQVRHSPGALCRNIDQEKSGLHVDNLGRCVKEKNVVGQKKNDAFLWSGRSGEYSSG